MNADVIYTETSHSRQLLRSLRSLSVYSSLIILVTGCIVLVGWAIDIDILKTILPEHLTMKANTAIGFIVSSIVLWSWLHQYNFNNSKFQRIFPFLIKIASFSVILLGLLTLIEHYFQTDLNIDQILFSYSPDPLDPEAPGRMAPNTAISFILSGSALILLAYQLWRLAQLFSLFSFSVGLVSLTGHLYAVVPLYSAGSVSGMAFHTAILFMILSLGILFACADQGWMQELTTNAAGGIMARRLIPILGLLPLFLGLFVLVLYEELQLTAESAFALRSVLGMIIYVAIVWRNAKTLNRIDYHRQEIQQHLINSERRFRAILDQTYQFIGLLQPNGILIEINQTALEFRGLNLSEVRGKPIWEIYWPNSSIQTQNQFKQAIATAASGEFVRNEVEMRDRENQIAIIDFSLKPIQDEQRNVTLLIFEGREITDYKKAQQALERSQARYRAIVEDQTELICRYHADTTISFVNDAYCRYFCIEREALIGNSYNPIIYEADYQRVLQEINTISLENPTVTIENRVVVNGEIRWTQWNNRAIFNSQGELIEYQSVGRDISELKQKEEELRQLNQQLTEVNKILQRREEQFRALAENIPDSITRHDRQYRYLYTNPACRQQSGFPPEVYLGKIPSQLGYPEEMTQMWEASLETVFLTGEMRIDEFEVVNQNEVKSYQTQIVPEFAPDGSVLSVLTISRDITQLRQLNEYLEDEVEKRTAQLAATNTQLREEIRRRQAVQRELIQQKRLLESFFESSPVGMIIYDKQLRFMQLNTSIAEMNGVSIEASLGRTVEEILPDIAPQINPRFQQVLQTGKPVLNVEISGETPQHPGVTRYWQASYFPILRQDHQVMGIGAVIVEISDRKRTEIALQQSEERFRKAIIEAPFPILIHAEDGKIMQISNTLSEITGYTFEEIPTVEDWTERAYGERQNIVLEVINQLYRLDHRVDEGEWEVRTKNGTHRIWNFSSAPLGKFSDRRRLVISMAADITERKQAEIALATRLRQQAIITQLGQMALSGCSLTELFDQTTELVAESLSAQYCKVLELLPDGERLLLRSGVGWREGLVGKATLGSDNNSQASYTLAVDEPVIVENLTTESRFNGPSLLQEHHVISGVSTIIEGRNHRPFGVLGVHSTEQRHFTPDDVNFVQAIANLLAEAIARKQTEQEINELNSSLERRVKERTQQLEDANQEMNAFSYSVAHDLRAPLRAIQGFAQVLIEDYSNQLDELAKEYINRMGASAERLDQLIQDLLDYSRLGRTEIQLRRINLASVIQGIIDELQPELEATQAQILIDSSLPMVRAQRSVLKQVMTNLISNAIKFVQPGVSPIVSIRAEKVGDNHLDTQTESIRIWIEDNGIGISAQHQERIFRAFERLHGVEAYPGTGIGLAIVKRGVERMGGRVGVESDWGHGSRFWIELIPAESKLD
ncbi:PAS domain S-box protein [Capilliphycus salinus ALCB114379]|uniref:PAS domain S-box protein n=1 Tax=Capilliphycus salinus TaxID=2768948 RepID=UPI0039A6AFAD